MKWIIKVISKKENFTLAIAFFLLFFLVLVFSFTFRRGDKREVLREQETVSKDIGLRGRKVENCEDYSYEQKHEFEVVGEKAITEFENNEIKLLLGGTDFVEELIDETRRIYTYDYSPQKRAIAYIASSEDRGSENLDNVVELYIYFLESGYKQLIYSLQSIPYEDTEYFHVLRDVGFSDDGTLLGITTSESLLVYDLETEELSTLFSKEKVISPGVGWVFDYLNPRFSPNNTKILLDTARYEGRGGVLFDKNTESLIELPYFIYVGGEIAVGWNGDNEIIVIKIETDRSEVYSVDTNTLEEEKNAELEGRAYGAVSNNGRYYFYVEKNLGPSGKYLCNREKQLYEVRTEREEIYKLDLSSNELTKLLSVDSTHAWGKIWIRGLATIGDSSDRLIVRLHHDESWYSLNEIDGNKPGELTRLEL